MFHLQLRWFILISTVWDKEGMFGLLLYYFGIGSLMRIPIHLRYPGVCFMNPKSTVHWLIANSDFITKWNNLLVNFCDWHLTRLRSASVIVKRQRISTKAVNHHSHSVLMVNLQSESVLWAEICSRLSLRGHKKIFIMYEKSVTLARMCYLISHPEHEGCSLWQSASYNSLLQRFYVRN